MSLHSLMDPAVIIEVRGDAVLTPTLDGDGDSGLPDVPNCVESLGWWVYGDLFFMLAAAAA